MRRLNPIVLLLSLSLLAISMVASPLSLDASYHRAYTIFEKYCSWCHNGVRAPSWNQTLRKIRLWALLYKSIDEAVKREYKYLGGAKNYFEMMMQMKRLTPGISEEEFKQLYNFFLQYYNASKRVEVTATIPVFKWEKHYNLRLYSNLARANLVSSVIVFVTAVLVAYAWFRGSQKQPP